jgi:Uma2 family endonuclease
VYPYLDIDRAGAIRHDDGRDSPAEEAPAMAIRVVLTYADLATLPADGNRYELHEGEISVTAAPRPRHQLVVGNIYLILAGHVRQFALGEIFLAPIDVILSDVTVLEPDLVYVDAAGLGLVTERGIEGAPTLAIEVLSPATAAKDRGVKLQLYRQYGVPHYWMVDTDAQVIETYRLAGQAYEAGPRLEGAAPAPLPPFEGLVLDPSAVWR